VELLGDGVGGVVAPRGHEHFVAQSARGEDGRSRGPAGSEDDGGPSLPRVVIRERIEDPVDIGVLRDPAARKFQKRVGGSAGPDVLGRPSGRRGREFPRLGDGKPAEMRIEAERRRPRALPVGDRQRQVEVRQSPRAKERVVQRG
jgi:hypothetical protein